jgi:hypothetical protein
MTAEDSYAGQHRVNSAGNTPDDELVVVGVVLGAPDPVRVAGQHLDRAAQVAAVPHLHLAVAPGGDQRERLVRVVVHAPEGDRYTQQCKYCITCSNALHSTEMISPRRR